MFILVCKFTTPLLLFAAQITLLLFTAHSNSSTLFNRDCTFETRRVGVELDMDGRRRDGALLLFCELFT